MANISSLIAPSGVATTADLTDLVSTSDTQTTATWETGTGTTESLVSPAKIKAAIDANASSSEAGAVGTYAMLRFRTLTTAGVGSTHSGADLEWSNAGGDDRGNVNVGTWRLMGGTRSGVTSEESASVFLRIL